MSSERRSRGWMVTARKSKRVPKPVHLVSWKETLCIKPAAKNGHFIYKLGFENSHHDSGKWLRSKMLRKQNIKAAFVVGRRGQMNTTSEI